MNTVKMSADMEVVKALELSFEQLEMKAGGTSVEEYKVKQSAGVKGSKICCNFKYALKDVEISVKDLKVVN